MKKFLTVTLLIAVFVLSCDNGGKDPAHTHDWEWVVTIPATIEADGLETETCKTCGAINGTRPIAQLPDDPKTQSATITGLLDNNSSATVTGTFTNAEWNGVAEKIKTALNARFNAAPDPIKDIFRNKYSRNGITIVVEKTTEYTNYKTIGDGKTMYINYAILNNEDAYSALGLALRNSAAGIDLIEKD